ncbi:DNA-binding response regulator [Litorimonas cladophorae]|uniref:Phosphate regulon transcriptional regulatory protein PhoB n=1 Tax=Litorimonas cladophorae TaxID=1220491 RepID=A0A918NJC4_9PROT|nr:phosphate regulon transcriptional regulator PhoB [Litorimonas cladophorae]GGX71686.1 DNA-binding response regulator [Litorimonas cladophorae]
MTPYVLIVEDETAISTLLEYNLQREGFETALAEDGDMALLMAEERVPDLILLDWMLPKLSGVEVCRRLRRRESTSEVPIIMLSARGEEDDRVTGLDIGADDYIIKPFSIPELFARIRALLRRMQSNVLSDAIVVGDLQIDTKAHRVSRAGNDIHLGPTEFRLLEHFMRRPGQVFSREQLLDAVWGHDVYVEVRTVDVHIGRLRKALKVGDRKDPIRTVRSAGYALRPEL